MSKQHLTSADINYLMTLAAILADVVEEKNPTTADQVRTTLADIRLRFNKEGEH